MCGIFFIDTVQEVCLQRSSEAAMSVLTEVIL